MSAQKSNKVSDFVISRVSRLYPAYWISLFTVVALGLLFSVPKVETSPMVVAGNMTMIQRWLLIPNVNDVYWTLAVEMQFYLVIFLLLLLTRSKITTPVITRVVYTWLVIAVVVSIAVGSYSRGIDPQYVVLPVRILLNITLSEFGPLFCLGMFAYLVRNHSLTKKHLVLPLIVSILNAALLHDLWYSLVVAILALVFLTVTLRANTRILTTKPLLFFGKISYSMYIIHSIPGYIIITLTIPFVGRDLSIIVAFICATLLAWALHNLGEVKGTQIMKSLLLRARDRKTS